MTDPSPPFIRPRLDFMHGLRGLLALVVVLFHLTLVTPQLNARGLSRFLAIPLLHGYLAVPAFLVLSGFLLSVPLVLRSGQFSGGLRGFFWRRSVRILPPYYASYVLHLVFFVAMAWLLKRRGGVPDPMVDDQMLHAYTAGNLLSHLLLIHNLVPVWAGALGGVFWTIACEWQVYFLFALVLVPLWRRFGLWAAVLLALVVAAVLIEARARNWWHYITPEMIPVFTCGMVAAEIILGSGLLAHRMRGWHWGGITLGLLGVLVAVVTFLDATMSPESLGQGAKAAYYHLSQRVIWISDLLAGIWIAAVIVWLTLPRLHRAAEPNTPPDRVAALVLCLLEAGPVQWLGRISYSLYLCHILSVFLVMMVGTRYFGPGHGQTLFMMGGGLILSVASSWVFYRVFERPSMTRETRQMFSARSGHS